MFKNQSAGFLLLILNLCSVNSLNILGIFPYSGLSHFKVYENLINELLKSKHNLTIISHYPQQNVRENLTDISIRGTSEMFVDYFDVNWFSNTNKYSFYFDAIPLSQIDLCSSIGSKNVQKFLKTDSKFDMILVEMFTSNCYLALVKRFNVPFIGVTSGFMMPWNSAPFANIENPAYIPVMFTNTADKITFFQRVENSIAWAISKVLYHYLIELPSLEQTRKLLNDNTIPPLREIAANASALLVNAHFALHRPRPLVPNVIEVGGLHIKQKQQLPKNIEKWINESDHGVIYLSMGSMIKGHSFPPETRDAFIRAFDRIPQRVLWKWENDTLPGKTDKIMIQKWMPQFDILCHPNVKAYIAHGGLLGTTEAVHCGVPTIVLPQYGDQFVNGASLQEGGGGIVLDFKTLTEDIIYDALKTILDPGFKKQAEELSARFRDRPIPPMETAIYWIEYVARHKGTHHMKSAAVGMPWYQYLLIDVVAFLAAVLITIILATYCCIKILLRLLFKKKNKVKNE